MNVEVSKGRREVEEGRRGGKRREKRDCRQGGQRAEERRLSLIHI